METQLEPNQFITSRKGRNLAALALSETLQFAAPHESSVWTDLIIRLTNAEVADDPVGPRFSFSDDSLVRSALADWVAVSDRSGLSEEYENNLRDAKFLLHCYETVALDPPDEA